MAGDVTEGSRPWPLILGAVIAAGTLTLYAAILIREGNNTLSDVAWVLALLLAAIHAAVLGVVLPRYRRSLAVVAGVILLGLGVVGIFSIGLLLIAAAVCCFLQLRERRTAG